VTKKVLVVDRHETVYFSKHLGLGYVVKKQMRKENNMNFVHSRTGFVTKDIVSDNDLMDPLDILLIVCISCICLNHPFTFGDKNLRSLFI